ncbi:MAG: DUF808 domain-containing protein [Magnetococcales bacterium]|nr:DUF808 domain-containing protein [Magnetococcales bacterium]
MAGTSLLTLIDDIATLLDDVAVMSKIAAKKTAGVLGDDLALNAQQVAGVQADRELPVVWAVAVGSFKNKFILVPAALAISAILPWAITPLLMLGGAYLCYEGFEKIFHSLHLHQARQNSSMAHATVANATVADATVANATAAANAIVTDATAANASGPGSPRLDIDRTTLERDKIAGAIRTDFILSAEIITIALGTVATAPFPKQVMVLTLVAVGMTIGVYGVVAAIVKLDDGGAWLLRKSGDALLARVQRGIGKIILVMAPWLMKLLSIVGTVAMFMVGGGILTHGIPGFSGWVHDLTLSLHGHPGVGTILAMTLPLCLDILTGVVTGGLLLFAMKQSVSWQRSKGCL